MGLQVLDHLEGIVVTRNRGSVGVATYAIGMKAGGLAHLDPVPFRQ